MARWAALTVVRAAQATRGRHAECAYLLDRALKHPESAQDFATAALDALRLAIRPAYSALLYRSSSGMFRCGDDALAADMDAIAEILTTVPWLHLSSAGVLRRGDGKRTGLAGLDQAMSAAALVAVIPLVQDAVLLGCIVVGPRDDRTSYTADDFEFCERIAARLCVVAGRELLAAEVAALRTAAADSERLASVGRMAAGLAHEIRNPLVSIRTFTQLLPERHADEEFRNGFLDLTLAEIDRISTLVGEILRYARPEVIDEDSDEHHATDVGDCVERTCLLLRSHARSAGVVLDFQGAELSARGAIDEDKLRQVVINLVVNGIQACEERGRVSVSVVAVGSERIAVEVCDDGPGMEPEVATRIFQPFFTTRREGTGLGLALVQKILAEADATIGLTTSPGGGSTFRVEMWTDLAKATATTSGHRAGSSPARGVRSSSSTMVVEPAA